MYLTRKQSLSVALGALALFFAGGIGYLRASRPAAPEAAPVETGIEPSGPTPLPDAAPTTASLFVLNNFHRSEMKDGKKVWEVTALKGQYFPETNSAKLEQATLLFYQPNGEVVQMNAANALLSLTGMSLTRAEISGQVKVVYGDKVTLETELAVYEREKNLVSAPGEVSISSEQLDIVGRELTARLDTNEVRLAKNVVSTVKQKSLRRGEHA